MADREILKVLQQILDELKKMNSSERVIGDYVAEGVPEAASSTSGKKVIYGVGSFYPYQ